MRCSASTPGRGGERARPSRVRARTPTVRAPCAWRVRAPDTHALSSVCGGYALYKLKWWDAPTAARRAARPAEARLSVRVSVHGGSSRDETRMRHLISMNVSSCDGVGCIVCSRHMHFCSKYATPLSGAHAARARGRGQSRKGPRPRPPPAPARGGLSRLVYRRLVSPSPRGAACRLPCRAVRPARRPSMAASRVTSSALALAAQGPPETRCLSARGAAPPHALDRLGASCGVTHRTHPHSLGGGETRTAYATRTRGVAWSRGVASFTRGPPPQAGPRPGRGSRPLLASR